MNFLNKKIIILSLGSILVIFTGFGIYFFITNKKEKIEYIQKLENYSMNGVVKELNRDPSYLEGADFQKMKLDEFPTYFRQGLLSFRYSVDPKREFGLEIEKKFQGEAGRVVHELFKAYYNYESYLDELNKNDKLDDYEKWNEKIRSRENFFGKELGSKMFPKKNSETIEKFFLYSKRYLKKHDSDDFRSKNIHIEKARKEIYGEDYFKLLKLEPLEEQLELELNLRQREMKIMNEKEKESVKIEIFKKLNK